MDLLYAGEDADLIQGVLFFLISEFLETDLFIFINLLILKLTYLSAYSILSLILMTLYTWLKAPSPMSLFKSSVQNLPIFLTILKSESVDSLDKLVGSRFFGEPASEGWAWDKVCKF